MKLQNDFFPENNNLLFLAVTFFFPFLAFFLQRYIYVYMHIMYINLQILFPYRLLPNHFTHFPLSSFRLNHKNQQMAAGALGKNA